MAAVRSDESNCEVCPPRGRAQARRAAIIGPHHEPVKTMKIPVPVKRVVAYNVKVRVKADGRRIDTANVTMSIKPVDEIAVEHAVRLKEACFASEAIAVSCGG